MICWAARWKESQIGVVCIIIVSHEVNMRRKHVSHYCLFVRGIRYSQVGYSHKSVMRRFGVTVYLLWTSSLTKDATDRGASPMHKICNKNSPQQKQGQTHIKEKDLQYFLLNYPLVHAARHNRWLDNIGSGNDMLPYGNKSLPEPMYTQIYVTIGRHSADIELNLKVCVWFESFCT